MKKELQIVDPKEFGVQAEKAKNIESSFMSKHKEVQSYTEQYNECITKELNPETYKEARELRQKLVKVRTGIAEVHKAEKAFFLASGRYVDALKNKMTVPIEQMEAKLREIEEHEERQLKAQRDELKSKRSSMLAEYGMESSFLPLAEMTEEQFDGMLNMAKNNFEKKKKEEEEEQKRKEEEEKKKEEERKEEERLKALEQSRKDITAPYHAFIDWSSVNLREQTKDEFETMLSSAKKSKAEHDKKQEEIQKENEKLKKEREEQDKKNKAEQDRLNKIAQENAEKAKKLQDEKEKKEKEEEKKRKEEEEAKKALENADDKVKFKKFFEEFKLIKFPELKDKEITQNINRELDIIRKFMVEQSKKLL